MAKKSIKAYKKNATHGLAEADPHTQVAAIMDHILVQMVTARGAIERCDPQTKGVCIGKALELISILQASLDMEVGGEISENLYRLYDFITLRLGEASVKNSVNELDDAQSVLKKIKEGWDGIPQEIRDEFAQKKREELAVSGEDEIKNIADTPSR